MLRAFSLILSSLLFLFSTPNRIHTAEAAASQKILEPPEEHEEWRGSIGALWIQYPLECAVWDEEEKRTIHCHRDGDIVNLTISPSQDPLLYMHGMILGKTVEALAVKKGNILEVSGAYDIQKSTLSLTTEGAAQDFTFRGTYDNTPFQGKGSYKPDSVDVSLSFTKTFPITGTLEIHRVVHSPSSSSGLVEFSSSAGTGITLTATGVPPATSDGLAGIPAFPLLSSGTIEGATQQVFERVQDTGQAFTSFSRILTLVFQTMFAVLVVLVLITFGFLLRHLKKQQSSPPLSSPPSSLQNPHSKDPTPPHH